MTSSGFHSFFFSGFSKKFSAHGFLTEQFTERDQPQSNAGGEKAQEFGLGEITWDVLKTCAGIPGRGRRRFKWENIRLRHMLGVELSAVASSQTWMGKVDIIP